MSPIKDDWKPLPLGIVNVREYAESKVSSNEWKCLDELWDRESSWRTKKRPWLAVNRSSGAYGIPQSLPGNKMASEGSDWRVNPQTQIDWGIKYINQRYGSACAALRHHDRRGWY